MKKQISVLVLALALSGVAAGCTKTTTVLKSPRTDNDAYWQRVEDNSAMRMTGPKAQQRLEEDLASCVRRVDEMVELGALRRTLPPDTHAEYRHALDASGDLAFYETPTRLGDKRIAHSDFHDFEGCMRHAGWERVKYVRYHVAEQAQKNYQATNDLRTYGVTGKAAEFKRAKEEGQDNVSKKRIVSAKDTTYNQ